ncbi:hypothetical protein GCM10010448_46280 [Streptomyces glomeratus]|uniref:Uncharacterized protein n=1 Tax=Streptomyces glomeratus TaxID=284452 RepID=A0ABP6LWA2_9ACTN
MTGAHIQPLRPGLPLGFRFGTHIRFRASTAHGNRPPSAARTGSPDSSEVIVRTRGQGAGALTIGSVSGGWVRCATFDGHENGASGGQLAQLARSWAARRSTEVARMEYCCEPWVRPPARVSEALLDRREGASCTG